MNGSSKAFVDTNIFVYSLDSVDIAKNRLASELIRTLNAEGTLTLSTQALRELVNVYSKPRGGTLTLGEVMIVAREVIEPNTYSIETTELIRSALGLKIAHGINFYDALILQAAIELGCKTLYSEDFEHGRTYSGVSIVNPFIK